MITFKNSSDLIGQKHGITSHKFDFAQPLTIQQVT